MLKYYLDKTGKVIKSILFPSSEFVDTEPREGSLNPITSGGVSKAVGDIKAVNRTILAAVTNPLNLPAKTIRCKFQSGYTPTMGDSRTLVDEDENVWDITKNSSNWASLFVNKSQLLEVIGANTSGVEGMGGLFWGCTNLVSVPLFDTSSVTDMSSMFNWCSSITSVPLFDTSKVTRANAMFSQCLSLKSVPLFDTSSLTNMNSMFYTCTSLTSVPLFNTSKVTSMNTTFKDCTSVASGTLALYQQASTQTTPPTEHTDTFLNCGSTTATGTAELEQIPASWGGTGPEPTP